MSWYSWYVTFVYVVIMIKRGVSTERFANIRYCIRNLKFKIYFYILIEFNTLQKHSADSKFLPIHISVMSVAAIFQKFQKWMWH